MLGVLAVLASSSPLRMNAQASFSASSSAADGPGPLKLGMGVRLAMPTMTLAPSRLSRTRMVSPGVHFSSVGKLPCSASSSPLKFALVPVGRPLFLLRTTVCPLTRGSTPVSSNSTEGDTMGNPSIGFIMRTPRTRTSSSAGWDGMLVMPWMLTAPSPAWRARMGAQGGS